MEPKLKFAQSFVIFFFLDETILQTRSKFTNNFSATKTHFAASLVFTETNPTSSIGSE